MNKTILSTHETNEEAWGEAHKQAKNLRKLKLTHRYGITVQPVNTPRVWHVVLVDRMS